MKVTVFTDPHLGVSRQAHTTRESAARLKSELYEQAMMIIDDSKHPLICVGDLFDKAQNNEATLVQGYNVASRCQLTLSGNHDELNREGVVTSLQALKDMGVKICSAPTMSDPYFEAHGAMYFVPHHASQELFLLACGQAAIHAAEHRDGQACILFLHCNYDFSLAIEDNTLNLPASTATVLLEQFDKILIGHEHNPSLHQEGRVVILGNTMPTSFADISDKFSYTLDLETAELTKHLVWAKDNHYVEIELGSELPPMHGIEFVDVVGIESAGNALEISKFIRSIWEAAQYELDGKPMCSLIAVRNKVVVKDALKDVDSDAPPVALDDLKSRIKQDLAGSDLEVLFTQLLGEVA